MKKNIVLIGFMAVGKGAVARELCALTGRIGLDCDDLIQSMYNQKIKEIFAKNGEEKFRQIEQKLANFLAKNVKGAIISTGGGFYKVKKLKKIGKIIYLRSSFDEIINRINSAPNSKKKLAKRPLLKDLKKARTLHEARDKEYMKKADFIVVSQNKSPTKIAKEILKILKDKK